MAYKRELIINNGSLTSYKKLLKVSDVCQLLDKRTFGTRTYSGTTAAYNNDGTFTVFGTAIAHNWKNFPVFQLLPGGGEHVYLFDVVGISGDANCHCNIYFYDEITDRAVVLMRTGWESSAVIKKLKNPTVYQARFNITTLKGATPNYIVYKPQLFDLTEMYGAGNEPATVAEFKAKFPNELYDYSPRYWVTSYKTGLVAKTKNLFDKSKAIKGRAIRYIDGGEYDDAPYYASDYINVSGISTLTITPTYETPSVCFYDKNKTFISSTRTMIGVSVPSNAVYIRFDNKLTNLGTCQLEKGSTATDYVPYGYL